MCMHLCKHLNILKKKVILICKRSIQALKIEGRKMDGEGIGFHRDHSLHKKELQLIEKCYEIHERSTIQVND